VCIALCTIVSHNIAQNRPDNFPSYPPDNHHCSDDVYLRVQWFIIVIVIVIVIVIIISLKRKNYVIIRNIRLIINYLIIAIIRLIIMHENVV